uniref:Uncharacterized protein n=1 Tax=Theropithecus gelada TaxID=9565 RepID=A0A8D2GCE2_THEGE
MHSLLTAAPVPTALAQVDREKIYQWINELSSPETRENALLELRSENLFLTLHPCSGIHLVLLQHFYRKL